MLLALSIGDKFLTGLYTALIGIGIVFLMLAILVVMIAIMAKINLKLGGNLSNALFKRNQTAKTTESNVPEESSNELQSDFESVKSNAAIVAAITAALYSYMGSSDNGPKADFIVRSIRKI